MVSIAERVAFLEGQSGEQIAATDALRVMLVQIGQDVNDLRGELRGSVTGLQGELRDAATKGELRDAVAGLLGELRNTVTKGELRDAVTDLRRGMDRRFELIDRRFERLEDKFDRRLTWLVGTQVATLLAVVGALAAPYFQ